jgi:amino-acid N-acetyltransferase
MKLFQSPNKEAVIALLKEANLPTADVTAAMVEGFFACGDHPDRPSGVIGLEIHGDLGLLRSLVVRADARGSGRGRALVDAVESYARARGVKALYLLTDNAQGFFLKLGYHVIARTNVPETIRVTKEFSTLCPGTAWVMWKFATC